MGRGGKVSTIRKGRKKGKCPRIKRDPRQISGLRPAKTGEKKRGEKEILENSENLESISREGWNSLSRIGLQIGSKMAPGAQSH